MKQRNKYNKKDSLTVTENKAQNRLTLKRKKNNHSTQQDIMIDIAIIALTRKIKELDEINNRS